MPYFNPFKKPFYCIRNAGHYSVLFSFFFCAISLNIYAAEEISHAPQIVKTEQSIRDQVKVLRQQRYDQMPYLDRGFVKSEIRPEKIREKQQFIAGNEKNLKTLISRAVEVHIPVRAAHERISLARRRILVALRNLFPETKFQFETQNGNYPSSLGPFTSKEYKFSFRQPIFHGGILWNTLLKEKAGLEAAEKDYQDVVEDVVNEVSKAYFDYNRALKTVQDQEKSLEKMKRFANISKQKYESQLISEIENLNVQSLFSQMEYDYETSKQELELAKLDLQKFLDLQAVDDLKVAPLYDVEAMLKNEQASPGYNTNAKSQTGDKGSSDFTGSMNGPTLSELSDLAYQHRAKLQVEASKLQAARLEERVKWGEMLPQTDVVLEFGRLGNAFDINDPAPALQREFHLALEMKWNAGGNKLGYTLDNQQAAPSISQFLGSSGSQITKSTFTMGLFDGLSELADAKEAEVQRLEQVIELEKAEKEVMHDVKKSYFDYQKAQIQVRSSLQRMDYQSRLAKLSEHRLEKNEIQISEYLKAEIDYLQALTSLHKALGDYFSAKAKLNHDIGIRNYLPVEEWYGSKSSKT